MVRETVAPGAQARWQVIGPEFPEREQQPVGEVFGQPAQPRERRVDPALEREEARQPCGAERSEEHTSELQSLMRNSYAVFCLKTKQHTKKTATLAMKNKRV